MNLFRWLTIAVCLYALHSMEAKAAEWDNTDRALFGAFVALQVIDVAQTWKASDDPEHYREANPVFGDHPNMLVVVGAKAAVTGLVYWAVRDMPSADRKLILSIVDALQFVVVGSNYSVGLKWGF